MFIIRIIYLTVILSFLISLTSANIVFNDSNNVKFNTGLDLTNQELTGYFGSPCSSGEAITGVMDDGTFSCSSFATSGPQNLSQVLQKGNTANQSIEFSEAIEIGSSVSTDDDRHIAIGNNAVTSETGSNSGSTIAIGEDSYAESTSGAGNSALSIGYESNSIGWAPIAIGRSAEAIGNYGISIGTFTDVSGPNSIGIGKDVSVSSCCAVVLGLNSSVGNNNNAIAIGRNAFADNPGGAQIAVGLNSVAEDITSIAQGFDSRATGERSLAIGSASRSTDEKTVAVGENAQALSRNSVAVGADSEAINTKTTAIGWGSEASGDRATALGDVSRASGDYSVSLGHYSSATSSYGSTSVGYEARTPGTSSVALGVNTAANEDYSIALGPFSNTYAEGAVAVGNQAHGYNAYEATFGNLEGQELDINVTGNATVHENTVVKQNLVVEGIVSSSNVQELSFMTGHTGWVSGLSDEEIARFGIEANESFVLDRFDVQLKGGGEDSGFTAEIYDESQLNSVNIAAGTTETSNTQFAQGEDIIVEVTNINGSEVEASVLVEARAIDTENTGYQIP